jgi:hypothetical protein
MQDEPADLTRMGSLSLLATDVLILAVITAGTLMLGTVAFRLGIWKAQRYGGLSRMP